MNRVQLYLTHFILQGGAINVIQHAQHPIQKQQKHYNAYPTSFNPFLHFYLLLIYVCVCAPFMNETSFSWHGSFP